MPLLYKLSISTLFQIISRFFSTFANFIAIILIAKSLGSFGLGQFNKVFAIIGILSLFIDFGINAYFIKKNKEEDLPALILLRLIIAIFISIFIIPIISFLPYNEILKTGFSGEEKNYILAMLSILFLYSFMYSQNSIFQKRERFDLMIYPNILYGIVVVIFSIYSFFSKNLLWFFAAQFFGVFTYVIISFLVLKIKISIKEVNLLNYFNKAKIIFKYSLPLGITLLLNVLYVKSDVLILSFFKSTNEVGIYTLAYKFFDFPLNISFFIVNAFYPVMLNKIKSDKKLFLNSFTKTALIIGLFGILISMICILFAPIITYIKDDFQSSIGVFRILSLSYPVFFLTNLILWILIALDYEKQIVKVYLFALVFNIVLNLIFVPIYSYNASAIITGVSELLVFVILFIKFIKIKKYDSKD